jgi:hypothetical protein
MFFLYCLHACLFVIELWGGGVGVVIGAGTDMKIPPWDCLMAFAILYISVAYRGKYSQLAPMGLSEGLCKCAALQGYICLQQHNRSTVYVYCQLVFVVLPHNSGF